MIFHENRLLADDYHEISYHIFFRKLEKMSQNLSSVAVVIGALRVNQHKTYLVVFENSKLDLLLLVLVLLWCCVILLLTFLGPTS